MNTQTNQNFPRVQMEGYEVTFQPLPNPERDKLPPKLAGQLPYLPGQIKDDPDGMLFKISGLAHDYPNFLPFRNWLTQIYERTGNIEQAIETNIELVRQHPEYFFGKVSLAELYLGQFSLSEANELLGGENKSILNIVPGRTVFHISEFLGYYKALATLFCYGEEWSKAIECRQIMSEIDPHCPGVAVVDKSITPRGRAYISDLRKIAEGARDLAA